MVGGFFMQTIPTPHHTSVFSRTYWQTAASVFTDLRMLVIAAVFCAMRVAVDAISIHFGPDLYVTVSYLVTALGAYLYGPLMGLACGAITDTISATLFPKGGYFFPFIFIEMLGGFLFGLFLWRKKPTATNLIFSKLSVTVLCNVILNSVVLLWMYAWMGNPKTSLVFLVPRLIKNVALFPAECVLLALLFNALLPALQQLKFTRVVIGEPIRLKWYHYGIMAAMIPLAALGIWAYYTWFQ